MTETIALEPVDTSPESSDVITESPELSLDIPFSYANRHGILVLDENKDGILEVRCKEDVDLSIISEVRRHLNASIDLAFISDEEFNKLLRERYESSGGNAMQMMDGIEDDMDLSSLADAVPQTLDLLDSNDDAPIIRLINAILTEAVKAGASDVHIETFENRLVVRFRVDGVLQEVLTQSNKIAKPIVSRIKIMSKLDIAERRIPQDGRLSLKIAGHSVDVRVSTIPSGHGERVVMRLLDKQAGRLDLSHLGMADVTRDNMDKLIHKPHGIILVTGPTGSGKTTTLYAGLEQINDRSRNILTVEDPIEYYLDGIGQTQVNAKVDMTFARGLRAILRQDPDVVMIGEIRDLETAEIAVQASLTGHLVLSTLHTNTAVGAITRMRDMGVEPFLLSSSLVGVLAQRLVRVLCDSCKTAAPANETERDVLQLANGENATIYHAAGCEKCNRTGYVGRTGIYELVLIDDKLRNYIHDGKGEHILEQHARQFTPSIREDGRRKILEGVTTIEEVLRVTRED